VAQIPDWHGRAIAIQPLTNGITNTSFRVDVDGAAFVVRIPGEATELLLVDRANELHNTRAAAVVGVGPRLVRYLPGTDVMVLALVPGRALTSADLKAPGMPARLALTLRTLHAGPRFARDFDVFRMIDVYVTVADTHGIPLPGSYRARLATVRRIEAALAAHPSPTVPCHNDLVADNIVDDGRLLRLVDYEYSGNNDPAFELGNACRELGYGELQLTELCASYFGDASPARLARVHLYAVLSDVVWTPWAAIQAAISRVEFDFAGYGAARWARAEAALDAPDLGLWLDAVQRADPSRTTGGR